MRTAAIQVHPVLRREDGLVVGIVHYAGSPP
jgi:hypothetical protein